MDNEIMKQRINEIYSFLFGSTSQPDKISFVSKVNLMFDELSFLKKSLISGIFVFASCCIFLGGKFHQLDELATHNSKRLENNEKIIIDKLEYLEHQVNKR